MCELRYYIRIIKDTFRSICNHNIYTHQVTTLQPVSLNPGRSNSVYPLAFQAVHIVHLITRHNFELELPNLHQTCIMGCSRVALDIEVIHLDLQDLFECTTTGCIEFNSVCLSVMVLTWKCIGILHLCHLWNPGEMSSVSVKGEPTEGIDIADTSETSILTVCTIYTKSIQFHDIISTYVLCSLMGLSVQKPSIPLSSWWKSRTKQTCRFKVTMQNKCDKKGFQYKQLTWQCVSIIT